MNPTSPPLAHDDGPRTNEAWVAGLRRNDTAGLDVQTDLRRHLRRGLGRAFGLHGDLDDAALDDLTQEAMIRVAAKADTFRGDSRFTTWAMAVALRVAYTQLRRRRWDGRSLEDLGLSPDAPAVPAAPGDPTAPAGRRDLLASLRTAIDQALTPRQRAAVLGELAGMPTPLLARQLGTNANALYKLHHDARLRLREALTERGFSGADVGGMLGGAKG